MKTKNIHNIIKAIFLSSAFMLNSCIEEVFPENGSASIDQIGKSDQALDAMLNSVVAFIHKYNSYGSHANHDFGYSGYNLLRDAACEDFLCPNPREDRFSYNPQIQISAESETKRSIFREKDKTKRSKKESAQHSKSRNKSFVMTSVSAL